MVLLLRILRHKCIAYLDSFGQVIFKFITSEEVIFQILSCPSIWHFVWYFLITFFSFYWAIKYFTNYFAYVCIFFRILSLYFSFVGYNLFGNKRAG